MDCGDKTLDCSRKIKHHLELEPVGCGPKPLDSKLGTMIEPPTPGCTNNCDAKGIVNRKEEFTRYYEILQ